MRVRRLEHIPGFNIDRVAAAAGDDPDVLRLENLDTDIPPPATAMEATRAAIGEDDAMLDALFCLTDRARVVFLDNASLPSGWVVAPGELVNDVSRVQIYNSLAPGGFAQIGTRVRFVFSNEPVERLALLGDRVRRALAVAGDRS